MKLLQCATVLSNQVRGSRHSVVQFRRRRSLLKEFLIKPFNTKENVYAKLAAPVDKIVPINTQKTAITIDVLGEETYPKLTEWRRKKVLQRARRVLPLPISLTTDDQIGRIWKQRFRNSISKPNDHLTEKEKLLIQIPDFVKLMIEKDAELLKNAFPEIYSRYQLLISQLGQSQCEISKKDSQPSSIVPYFPFLSQLKNFDLGSSQLKGTESVEDKLLDEEYESYLKHHDMLQYFASNLNNVGRREYEPEIEGWTSQVWLR